MALRPSVQAALTNRALLKTAFREDNLTLDALVTELARQAKQVSDKNNLGRLEGMLATQAHTLDVLFNHLLRQAWACVGGQGSRLEAADRYMRLALRAQAQCRATAETLSEMKNPKSVAFVQAAQANIAGAQQVNNGNGVSPVLARAGVSEIPQNELLEHREHGNQLDLGAAGSATPSHPHVATVDAIHRPTNGAGKGASL
jgi:hypothetical protein